MAMAAGIAALIAGAALLWMGGAPFAALLLAVVPGCAAWFFVRRNRMRALLPELHDECACLGPAVRYDGFSGTIHEFSFARRAYGAAFEEANRKKVL
jgi:hypothetical protein